MFAHLTSRLLIAIALALVLPACKNLGKKEGDQAGMTDGDYLTGTPLPDRQEGISFLGANVDRDRFSPVYFAFDSYAVGSGEAGKIGPVAEFLRSSGSAVILGGFTDERGTPEYNRGLGERRALAVREALIRAGAPGAQIQTVSFGAEMPADLGSGESSWARNRRVEFGIAK